jgi:hypothetical protein
MAAASGVRRKAESGRGGWVLRMDVISKTKRQQSAIDVPVFGEIEHEPENPKHSAINDCL